MNPTFLKSHIGLLGLVLIAMVILIDPRLTLRSAYKATPPDKLQASGHPTWTGTTTPEQMCDVMGGGDSRESRGRLHASYTHWNELIMQGKTPSIYTLICSFSDNHSTRYQRWDFVTKRGTYEREIVWHGFRQRGDVDVPKTFFDLQ